MSSSKASVIIDYGTEIPSVRLSVFAELESDVHLASGMKIVNEDSGLEWYCTDLIKIEGKEGKENKTWAGYTDLVPPDGMVFPEGKYSLIYEDTAEQEFESTFSIDYPDDILDVTSEDFPDIIGNLSPEKRLALYSEERELLYYGKEKKEWKDNSSILKDYKNAAELRVCYTINDDCVICLMPSQKLRQL